MSAEIGSIRGPLGRRPLPGGVYAPLAGRGKPGLRGTFGEGMSAEIELAEVVALPSKQLILVDFPGYVKDMDNIYTPPEKALATFGGGEGLGKALSVPGTMLPLNFRPDEPLSHPIFGDYNMTNGLVLKVKTSKRNPGKFESEMVGQIRSTFRFGGMADFQFCCPNSSSTAESAENAGVGQHRPEDDDFDNFVDVARMIDEGPSEPLQLIPPIFSKIDQVQDYAFKQTPYYLYKEVEAAEEGGRKRIHRVPRLTKHPKHTIIVKWGAAPAPADNPAALRATDAQRESMAYLRGVFAARPIWSGLALKCHTPPALLHHLKAVRHSALCCIIAMHAVLIERQRWPLISADRT